MSDSDEERSEIQLGFLDQPNDPWILSRNYFPSKVGGRPSWLNPRDLPSMGDLTCQSCSKSLRFLLQLYAPFDEFDRTFHRTVFIFCCPNQLCYKEKPSGCVRAFRSQLPHTNSFYSVDPPKYDVKPESEVEMAEVPTCSLCGLPGVTQCNTCHLPHYCSDAHERAHGGVHKCARADSVTSGEDSKVSGIDDKIAKKYVFPEFELSMEDEPRETDFGNENDLLLRYENSLSNMTEEEKVSHEADGRDLEAIEKSLRTRIDEKFVDFSVRVARAPEQVVRYGSPEPLWVGTPGRACAEEVAPCERCGEKRKFEFQVMPQILHFLNVDTGIESRDTALDWGTLAVYTCARSCGDGKWRICRGIHSLATSFIILEEVG
eukprot:928106_1